MRVLPSPSKKEKGLAGVSARFFAMLVMVGFGTGGETHHSLASRGKMAAAEVRGRLAYALSPVALNLTVFSVLLCLLVLVIAQLPTISIFTLQCVSASV